MTTLEFYAENIGEDSYKLLYQGLEVGIFYLNGNYKDIKIKKVICEA